jgi:hypothetical protein
VDEILQTPEQKFDALSEALKKNYNPLINQPTPIPPYKPLEDDDFISQYEKLFDKIISKQAEKNHRHEKILLTALESILPLSDLTERFDVNEAIKTAFYIANEVEVKLQELDDLKKQVEYEATYGGK